MVKSIPLDLSFVVVYGKPAKFRPRGPKTVTRISVRVGDVEVAHKTVGFRYSQDEAITEFTKNARTFTRTEFAGLLDQALSA